MNQESTMGWTVTTAEPEPTLAAVTRYLAAMSGLRDALAIAANEQEVPPDVQRVLQLARARPSDWNAAVSNEHLLAIHMLLLMRRPAPVRLVSLRSGSIEGVIRDILKRLGWFARIIDASNALMPGRRDPDRFLEQARAVLGEAGDGEAHEDAYAVLGISGCELMQAYDDIVASAAGIPVSV